MVSGKKHTDKNGTGNNGTSNKGTNGKVGKMAHFNIRVWGGVEVWE